MNTMNFFQEKFGRYFLKLRTKRAKRKLQVNTFDTARNIAIVYNCVDKKHNQKIENFAQSIAGEHNDTKIALLGFCNDNNKLVHKTSAFSNTTVTKNDFSWYGTAKSDSLEKFVKTPFDILIDLSLEQVFPLEYVVQLSQASFKIGQLNQSLLYDFMIDIKNEKNIDYLIQQINVYLPSLKQK